MRWFRTLSAAAFITAACSATQGGGERPQPTGVVPDRASSAVPVEVTIHGTGFFASAQQSSGGGNPTLVTAHRAWLGEVELQAVTWMDVQTLRAVVPAGIAPGPYDLMVENALGERGSLSAAYTALRPARLDGAVSAEAPTVDVGQQLAFTLTLTNTGETAVTGISFAQPTIASSDGGAVRPIGTAPVPPDAMAPGEQRAFSWMYEPTYAGHLAFSVSATGIDDASGEAVTVAVAPATVLVQQPAALVAAIEVAPSVNSGADFTVTATVTNSGGAIAEGVVVGVALSGIPNAATATLKAGPDLASATIASGASAVFRWTYTAGTQGGTLTLVGTALGTDANTGTAVVTTSPIVSTVIRNG